MKNHRFLWLRNRTTDNRKCEKARNIKEKRTIEMFSTVLKQLVELLSSQKDNQIYIAYQLRSIYFGASFNGFTQCHACVVQTTTRYAGVHKKLYKKITNRITIRMFKSIVKKKGDFNGK